MQPKLPKNKTERCIWNKAVQVPARQGTGWMLARGIYAMARLPLRLLPATAGLRDSVFSAKSHTESDRGWTDSLVDG
jgi:hypothetical protein